MVDAVRHVEAALGDGHKHLTERSPNKRWPAKASWLPAPSRQGDLYHREPDHQSAPGTAFPPCAGTKCWAKPPKRDFAEDEKIEAVTRFYAHDLCSDRHAGGIRSAAPGGAKAGGVSTLQLQLVATGAHLCRVWARQCGRSRPTAYPSRPVCRFLWAMRTGRWP